MSKYRKKFTPEAIEMIDGYAKELKPLAKYDDAGRAIYKMQVVDGVELLRAGVMDSRGLPGVPGVSYKVPVLCYVNHREEMENAFRNQGIEGIEAYVAAAKKRRADNEAFVLKNQKPVVRWKAKIRLWLKSLW